MSIIPSINIFILGVQSPFSFNRILDKASMSSVERNPLWSCTTFALLEFWATLQILVSNSSGGDLSKLVQSINTPYIHVYMC